MGAADESAPEIAFSARCSVRVGRTDSEIRARLGSCYGFGVDYSDVIAQARIDVAADDATGGAV